MSKPDGPPTKEITLSSRDVSKNWRKILPKIQADIRRLPVADEPVSTNRKYRYVALDCEMVGVGPGGVQSALARVSAVNEHGQVLIDKFVNPIEPVVDYRHAITGITARVLKERGQAFEDVQNEVADIIKGKIMVGHGLKHDFKVLFLSHPSRRIRDTSKYKPFRKLNNGGIPSLKFLSQKLLGVEIQADVHDSVQDANTAMKIYLKTRREWEAALKEKKEKEDWRKKHEKFVAKRRARIRRTGRT